MNEHILNLPTSKTLNIFQYRTKRQVISGRGTTGSHLVIAGLLSATGFESSIVTFI
jgi:hypothetical protein